jgi:hypothetical protein
MARIVPVYYRDPQANFNTVRFSAVDEIPNWHGEHPEAHVDLSVHHEVAKRFDALGRDGQMLSPTYGGEVIGAFAHPSMKTTLPTLLGMAVDEHRRRVGNAQALPTHGASLSEDSSAMVKNLRARGVDIPMNRTGNPGAEVTNSLHHSDRKAFVYDKYDDVGQVARAEDVAQGGRTVREVLRGSGRRQPPIQPTEFGEQQRLF